MATQHRHRLLDDPRRLMRIFGYGMLLFFIGLGSILHARHNVLPSLEQELYMLAGLIVGGAGFITVLAAHIGLLVGRLRNAGKY